MPKYLKSNSTAKTGVNYVRTIIEKHNCLFQEIDSKNDLGIDAIVEVLKDEKQTCKFLALQIKSGKSFFAKTTNLCKIPIKNHKEYWSNYPLPVFGIVYLPEFENAHWVNIKKYLKNFPEHTVISFEPTLANLINDKTFVTQFIPHLLNETPDISFELSVRLFKSEKEDEFFLGLHTLFKKYAFKNEVWDLFVEYFFTNNLENIPEAIVVYLSYIPWHPDLYYFKESYTEDSRIYAQKLLNNFKKDQIIKLLGFVDQENMISRGSIGQCVEAIVSSIPNNNLFLEEIIKDSNLKINLREVAAIIYAYHKGRDSVALISTISEDESWYIQELIQFINEHGELNPYA